MKRISVIASLVSIIFVSTIANAQVSINFNIGAQPAWGPTGYDHVDYYYLPDINVYYYVPAQQYYYQLGNVWRASKALPPSFKNFDFYKAHKVVINNVNKPYLNNKVYKNKYGDYKGKQDQLAIRDSKEEKYFESKDHPQHQQWENQHSANNGRSNNGRPNITDKNTTHSKANGRNGYR